MKFKKLTKSEMRIINYYVIHRDRSKAYRLGYPQSVNWKDETVKAKADEFFDSERIKYYRGFKDGGIVVADEDEIMTEEEVLYEIDRVPAVGAHNGGGRPSRYRPEFPQMMINFFDIGPQKIIENVNEETGEVTHTVLTNIFPTKEAFAASLRVSMQTLNDWATKKDEFGEFRYPEFAEAYEIVGAMQESILITNTLMGKYNANFAQFISKVKLGYEEKSKLVVEGGDKPIVLIGANMTAEEADVIYREFLLGNKEK